MPSYRFVAFGRPPVRAGRCRAPPLVPLYVGANVVAAASRISFDSFGSSTARDSISAHRRHRFLASSRRRSTRQQFLSCFDAEADVVDEDAAHGSGLARDVRSQRGEQAPTAGVVAMPPCEVTLGRTRQLSQDRRPARTARAARRSAPGRLAPVGRSLSRRSRQLPASPRHAAEPVSQRARSRHAAAPGTRIDRGALSRAGRRLE